MHVTADDSCEALFTADMGLEGNFECYNQLEVKVTDGETSWSGDGAVTIESGYAGEILTYTITDTRNDKHCWGEVKVEDKTAPSFICTPSDITMADGEVLYCTDIDDVLSGDLELPKPSVSDNCSTPEPW